MINNLQICIYLVFIMLMGSPLQLLSEAPIKNKIESLEIELKRNKANDTNKVNILNLLAFKYYTIAPNKGMEFARRGLQLATSLNFKEGMATAYRRLGVNYWTISDFPNALKNLLNAVKINQELKDNRGLASNYNNLSLVYSGVGFYEKSLQYSFKSIELEKMLPQNKQLARYILNIANVYRDLKMWDKALEYYFQAIDMNKISQSLSINEMVYINIASSYCELKDYKKSMEYFSKAIELNQKTNDKYLNSEINVELARLSIDYNLNTNKANIIALLPDKFQSISDAIIVLNNQIPFFKEINSLKSLEFCYNQLFKANKGINNHKEALIYHEKYYQLHDSVASINTKIKINFMETEKNIEKQNNNIALKKIEAENNRITMIIAILIAILFLMGLITVVRLLFIKHRQSNILEDKNKIISEANIELEALLKELSEKQQEIENANIELQEANATKDKFFSIISHDLRSPFTGIMGLSDLIATEADNIDMDEIKTMGAAICNSAKNTYELLNGLLEWSRSQLSSVNFNPIPVNLAATCSLMIKSSVQLADAKKIKINNMIDQKLSLNCDINMYSTIIRNLLSNAIKFTHSGGTISIESKTIDNFIQISVSDTGVGMDDKVLNSLFSLDKLISNKGTNNEKGSGFGLKLCREFVEKHGGTIWAESIIGEGSKISFTLPIV